MKKLENKIAVVAGATRGSGRGIACMLGEAGATVYCTGRSSRNNRTVSKKKRKSPFELESRPETIEETAEMVTSYGGLGIPVQVDHTDKDQVKALFERIKTEHEGIDILVNDIWGGDELTEWRKRFWELSLDKGLLMLQRAIHSHIITSHYAVPLMIKNGPGLIVEITDGDGFYYRGNLFYDLVKVSVIRLAFDMAQELRKYKITAVAVTPGFLRSEAMLEHFKVTEANWQDGAKKEPSFIASETPFYVGRAVAALASDQKVFQKTGRVFASWDLALEYDLRDIDGRQPYFPKYMEENMPDFKWLKCDDTFYKYWEGKI
jgi:NAD(P)-dependent dehydrogenase (short-subunit alcohol dehydrogenase family)